MTSPTSTGPVWLGPLRDRVAADPALQDGLYALTDPAAFASAVAVLAGTTPREVAEAVREDRRRRYARWVS